MSSAPSVWRVAEPEKTSPLTRDWFLRDSSWDDVCWTFAPTGQREEEHPVRVRWDFSMPSGGAFTDARHAELLSSMKNLMALIRKHSWITGRSQRSRTVAGYFGYARSLVRWMDQQGIGRFSDLDAEALNSFRHSISSRAGVRSTTVTPTTIQRYLYLLGYLYHHRDEIGDGLTVSPFQGIKTGQLAGVRESQKGSWPYTPDAVAVPLVQGAIDFLESSAVDILRAREVYAAAIEAAVERGCRHPAQANAAMAALHQMSSCKRSWRVDSLRTFAELLQMLYAACFIVISYLVGLRVSEILHLQAGCIQLRPSGNGADIPVMVGSVFKRESEYHGRAHEWVVPPPVIHAISVLEALSASHRARSGRDDLWLRPRGRRSLLSLEWQRSRTTPLHLPATRWVGHLLERFASWMKLPTFEGRPWQLSTSQGRKTFARFAALRDPSALLALGQHMGHRERAITDAGYSGRDYRLNEEIKAEILEQSVSAWEAMLAAPALGGRAGAEIVAKRPRFAGDRMKQDLKSYAKMLVDAGLTLGVCEWGFCVYREEYSACLGNAAGPNPVRREPSTCARCKNFAVSSRHRGYWLEQANRCEALLNEPSLPTQTLKIARERMREAIALVQAIDTAKKVDDHER